ncbi:MAG TPA: TetR/AcrR family transcriptional regulator [Acidimicrobiales bacterium]|jgi:AcrR family transcriptional regulator
MTEAVRPKRGRPKDATIDDRALAATRQLLIEEGHEAATIQRIAERSGLHPSSIYRRWPSRRELILDAAYADMRGARVHPTGDVREDLTRFVRVYYEAFDSPIARAAMPALLAGNPSEWHARTAESWVRVSVRPQFRAILAAAPADLVDPEIDADGVFDLVVGAVLARVLIPAEVRQLPPIERTVDLLMRMLAPRRA